MPPTLDRISDSHYNIICGYMALLKKVLIRYCLVWLAVFAGVILIGWNYCMQRTVHVQLRLDSPVPGGIQMYYSASRNAGFIESRCVSARQSSAPVVADADIPVWELYNLRLDFGIKPGEFTILGGQVGDIPLPPWKYWSFNSDVTVERMGSESGDLQLFSDKMDPYMTVRFRRPIRSVWTLRRDRILFLFMLSMSLAVAYLMGKILLHRIGAGSSIKRMLVALERPVVAGLSMFELFFLLLCGVYYSLWVSQPLDFSPDEVMRFEVTRFLFEHGRLPVNEETIFRPWGFSYAHIPTMFCNIFGALFMKIASLFSSDATTLLRAARMVGVLCITGTVFWTIRTSRLMFKPPFNWLPVCIVAFLPQFAYIGSYVNNDSAALLGVSMILFAWVAAINTRWNYRLATILSMGIAICAMSYYNSYSWIMFSVLMFPLTYAVRNGRTGLVKMGLFISIVSLVFGGYLFIRHLYLYGDLLGFATCRSFAVKYASLDFAPGVRKSLYERGISLPYMLVGMKWIRGSAESFVGFFGWLQYPIPFWCYQAYWMIFGIGALGVLWKGTDLIRNWRKVEICKWAFFVSLVGCATITIGLSLYYSYTRDYQAQGRYCFPALLPIAILSAKGLVRLTSGNGIRKHHGVIVLALCLLLGLVSKSSYLLFRNLF